MTKPFSRTLTICSSLLLLTAALASCNPNLPPNTTNPSPSPSASGSPEPGTSPSPTASPSASPSAITTPSPSPSASGTAFPSGSPVPTNTPIPTPTPIYAPSVSPGTATSTLTFRARVISGDRQVLPVIQGNFTANPYNLAQIRQDLVVKNKVEARPVAPQQTDPKYRQEQKVCTGSGCTTEQTVNMDAYREDLSRYNSSILPDWERRAYAGLEDAIRVAASGRESLNFTTDSNGEATLRLPLGNWFFSGRYSASGNVVVWESIPFDVTGSTTSIELTR